MHGLYALLDLPHASGLPVADIAQGLVADGRGARTLQLRAKSLTTADRILLLQQIAPRCKAHGVDLFVNDDVVAALAGIDGVCGVHWGQSDVEQLKTENRLDQIIERLQAKKLRFGISTHRAQELELAVKLGASYLGYGPVFPTRSKRNPEPCVGIDGLKVGCERVGVPIVAIGGIDSTTIEACIHAGAASVAMISNLYGETIEAIAGQAENVSVTIEKAQAYKNQEKRGVS